MENYYQPNRKYLIKEAKIILIYFLAYSTRVLMILPLIATVITLMTDGIWIGALPSVQWYPFDAQHIKYYFPVFFNQMTMGVIALAYYREQMEQ